jgi:5'-3' exoribonuclease 1
MGVPKFYRWISERYPQINQMISNSTLLPEIDNLYLDMNGIIHACTHPDDSSATRALTFRDMILAIFGYIDRIVTEIVKPKRKLFMAIDGVAPRAKLNQQRARRFRAAEDRLEAVRAAKKKGEEIDEQNMFDSNCITPGTEFMEKVGHHLRWFIRKKMKEDSIWKNLEITFSGHDVPGEGEHKIMQFIRESRCQPDYEPNQRHCMYGQDADLIMLGLATHEPHFTLLREVVNFTFGGGGKTVTKMKQTKQSQFQLLHLSILREYIELEFGANADCEVNKERLVDDFIFLTFLVGNDFLPHLPTLDIGEHAFDVIFTAYKSLLSESHGYLVCNGELADLSRFEKLCALIGVQEEQILQKREVDERDYNQKCRRRSNYSAVSTSIRSQAELDDIEEMEQLAFEEALREAMLGDADDDESDDSALDEVIEEESMNVTPFMSVARDDSDADINYEIVSKKSRSKRKQVMAKDTEESESNANTTKDYRGRYYYQKFKVLVQQDVVGDQFLNELISRYLEGLIWCLAYYCKGCVSWTWFFPYHYGPMLQDMKNLNIVIENVSFKIGQPFKPFQQLLGCLPPASASLMPQSYQWLMTSETSPVIGFYPFTFEVDMNGKRNPWEAVVLLPFIDENALLQAEEKYCPEKSLTTAERNRNSFGPALTHIFDPSNNSTYPSCNPEIFLPDIHMCYTSVSSYHPSLQPGIAFQNELIEGTATFMPGFPSLSSLGINDIETNFYKINVFGTASKYRTLVISINPDNSPWDEWTPKAIAKVINDKNNAEYDYDDDEDTAGPSPEEVVAAEDRLKSLLNSIVYVNYPQLHEARVVGISTETSSWRLSNQFDDLDNRIETVVHDLIDSEKWITDASQEEDRYLRGRGTPGSGGLNINRIYIRLRVCPLQGFHRPAFFNVCMTQLMLFKV